MSGVANSDHLTLARANNGTIFTPQNTRQYSKEYYSAHSVHVNTPHCVLAGNKFKSKKVQTVKLHAETEACRLQSSTAMNRRTLYTLSQVIMIWMIGLPGWVVMDERTQEAEDLEHSYEQLKMLITW